MAQDTEITSAMIAAGLLALFPNSVLDWQDEEEVVARIYRAMHDVGRATAGKSSGQSLEKSTPPVPLPREAL
jgi:hypothetical protein